MNSIVKPKFAKTWVFYFYVIIDKTEYEALSLNSPLTLEALHVLDAIDRRGSFSAAAQELDKAPSSLSYQIQKLEQDLDLIIYDRSGHKAKLTPSGKLLLDRGRLILEASHLLVKDSQILASGWELDLTIAYDGIIPVSHLFPLIKAFSKHSSTNIKLQEEILAGSWEALATGRADLLISPKLDSHSNEFKSLEIGQMEMRWVASVDHQVHRRNGDFDERAQQQYRIIAIADSARDKPPLSINVFSKQQKLTVNNFSAKVEALCEGLGIGTLPIHIAKELEQQGKLKMIEGGGSFPIKIIMSWKRDQLGKGKSWVIKNIKNHWDLK